jgi:catechol 2,3-dioxygenase-like lactoylglutathione lyase family enzyme
MLNSSQPINFVATSNPKKAREFYEKTLGLRFVSGDQFALVFDIGGIMLRIQIVDKINPQEYTSLGWKVTDIKKEVTELIKRGVKFERYEGLNQDQNGVWSSPSGGKIAWFKDPDKNILSLTQFQ